ncbi:MAG TPA: GlsB/YeaQ/YmgE family stress response membrane protein [Burkholderiales bacterium]|nr:GlsB/YeaQ/YmgE family stress response membrane protein [Burkholderiales bacterium]
MTTVMVLTAVVGILAAVAARAIMPGRQIMGLFGSAVAGTIGGLGAAYGGQAAGWFKLGEALAFVAAVLGAIAATAVLSRFFR